MPSSKLADAVWIGCGETATQGVTRCVLPTFHGHRAAPFGGSLVWALVRYARRRFRGALGVKIFVQCRLESELCGCMLYTFGKCVYPVKRGFIRKRFEFRRVRVTAAVGWCPPVSARPFKHSTLPHSVRRDSTMTDAAVTGDAVFCRLLRLCRSLFLPSLFSFDTSFS